MKELENESFIVIKPFMVTDLKLKGNSLLLYALIYGISVNKGAFYGSIEYMQTWCNASNRNVIDCLQGLIKQGLITKKKTGNSVIYVAKKYEADIENVDLLKFIESEESSQQSEESSLATVKKVHSKSEESSHNNIDIEFNDNIVKSINSKQKKKLSKSDKNQEYLNSLTEQQRSDSLKLTNSMKLAFRILDPKFNRKAEQFLEWQVLFAKFLIESDRTVDEIQNTMDFAMNDEFWVGIIYNPQKLINNYTTIYRQSISKKSKNNKVASKPDFDKRKLDDKYDLDAEY